MTWEQIQQQLKNQMTAATYQQWLALAAGRVEGDTLTITAPSEIGREWLDKRLRPMIERTTGLNLVVVCKDDPPKTEAVKGEYVSDYARTVKPERVEVHTQYFRRVWRPLLGPLLSELIRELRQRCYHGKGEDRERRPTVLATQPDLAAALGVAPKTIYRALKRDENGEFENPYLKYFILDMVTETRIHPKSGKMVNYATLFTVAIDEPIFPDFSNGQNVR